MSTGGGGTQTMNVTIDAVDMTRSILFFNYRGDSISPDDGRVRGLLTTSTNIRFYREDNAGLQNLVIAWHVVEFTSGVTVQRGSVEFTSATMDVTIHPVDTARSLVMTSGSASPDSVNYGDNDFIRGRLTSSTNLRMEMIGTAAFADWQVVEFWGASVQSGTGTLSGTSLSASVGINAVDLSKSILLLSWYTNLDVTTGANFLHGVFTDVDQISIVRGVGTSASINYGWQVIEFNDGTEVQSGTLSYGSSTTSLTATLQAVDLERTVPLLASAANCWGGSHNYSADDAIGPGMFTTVLSNSTTLAAVRAVHRSAKADLGWFTVQFGDRPSSILEKRVAASADDAEERSATGAMTLTSSDLELAVDSGSALTDYVGMRFTNITVPPGSTIERAYVQFTVDEATSAAASLTVRAHDTDDASQFTTSSGNITNRALTTASASWSPLAWSVVGEAVVAQRTPDISAVIQEVIDRPGWASGNDLAIIINGTGTRTAESYNGSPSAAPLLRIEYNSPPSAPSTLGPSSYVSGDAGTDKTPTLQFTQSDAETGDLLAFRIQIDNDSDFSSPVVDYTSAPAAQGATSFTVGQAEGDGSYTTGSEGQQLARDVYYWRVRSSDDLHDGSWATANSGSPAFYIGLPIAGACP